MRSMFLSSWKIGQVQLHFHQSLKTSRKTRNYSPDKFQISTPTYTIFRMLFKITFYQLVTLVWCLFRVFYFWGLLVWKHYIWKHRVLRLKCICMKLIPLLLQDWRRHKVLRVLCTHWSMLQQHRSLFKHFGHTSIIKLQSTILSWCLSLKILKESIKITYKMFLE